MREGSSPRPMSNAERMAKKQAQEIVDKHAEKKNPRETMAQFGLTEHEIDEIVGNRKVVDAYIEGDVMKVTFDVNGVNKHGVLRAEVRRISDKGFEVRQVKNIAISPDADRGSTRTQPKKDRDFTFGVQE